MKYSQPFINPFPLVRANQPWKKEAATPYKYPRPRAVKTAVAAQLSRQY